MKSYQLSLLPLSGISLMLSYITHTSKSAPSHYVNYSILSLRLYTICISIYLQCVSPVSVCEEERSEAMCSNSCGSCPAQSGWQDYDKYTLTQTHIGTHGSRHVLLIPLRKQPQTGSVMQRGSVGSRCRETSKAPDGTLICRWRFSI